MPFVVLVEKTLLCPHVSYVEKVECDDNAYVTIFEWK